MGGACSDKVHTKCWSENFEGKRSFERPRHRWEDTIAMEYGGRLWNVFIWVTTGAGGGLLLTR
jgi:hypothetical protein